MRRWIRIVSCQGLRRLGLAAALVVAASPAAALPVVLDLVVVAPTPALLEPGSSLFVDIAVSGLVAGDAPSLTAFELDLGFDDTAIDFVALQFLPFGSGVSLVNGSGQPCTLANLDGVCDVLLDSLASVGNVNLAAASLVAPADVNAAQPASGVLASLEFLVQAPGTTTLAFTQIALSGTISGTSQGTLAASASPLGLSVVPEPATLMLLSSVALALRRSARRSGRPALR